MKKPVKLLSFPELKLLKGIPFTRRYLRTLEAKGKFPRRRRIGGRTVVWVETEIDSAVEDWAKRPG
jgi:predicted DNA-binding transcriptional regulator AlpA